MSHTNGNFPLHQAAKEGEVNVVKDLLAKGADKDEKNDKGITPLMVAVIANHLDVVQFLMEQGVGKELADNCGALLYSADAGNVRMVQYLVELGLDKDKANNLGATALMIAAEQGHFNVVTYLVEQGAEKDKATNNGGTGDDH